MTNPEVSPLPKPPARFLISAPTLKKLASQEMALNICREFAHNFIDVCDDQYDWESFGDVAGFVPVESYVPDGIPALLKILDDSYEHVCNSLQRWYTYHKEKIFFDRETVELNEVLVKCIDELVLKPDGTVNFLETAKNLLISDAISRVEKFRFACINCMVDEIRNIWPLVRNDALVVNYDDEQKHPMIHYWVRTMLGDVRRFPGNDANSLENCAQVMKNMEWTAIGYFWNFLSQDEQVTFAGKLFQMKCVNNEPTTPELLMLNLDSKQLRSIITKERSIIEDLLFYFFHGRAACGTTFFQVWHYLTHFIRQSEFPNLMAEFVKEAFRRRDDSNYCRLVHEIWINTPIHLKRKIFSHYFSVHLMFEALDPKNLDYVSDCDYDMSFFIALLTECSSHCKNDFIWRKFWPNIIVGAAPSSLQQMMKLCFNNDEEIVQFKERYMMHLPDIHEFCCLLAASYRGASMLNEYLNFCSTNVHYVAAVKRQILASTDVKKAFLKKITLSSDFIKFDQFIDSAFFHEREARSYKRSLMLSSKKLQDVHAIVKRKRIGVSWI